MSLAEALINAPYRIRSFVPYGKYSAGYAAAGIRPGSIATVVCRHPARQPKFVEVELDNGLLMTIPISLAHDVSVEAA